MCCNFYMSSRKLILFAFLSMVLFSSNMKITNYQYLKISLLNHIRPLELLITRFGRKNDLHIDDKNSVHRALTCPFSGEILLMSTKPTKLFLLDNTSKFEMNERLLQQ